MNSIPMYLAYPTEKDVIVCVFCDREADGAWCWNCREYKGLMTVADWEEYTGQSWD